MSFQLPCKENVLQPSRTSRSACLGSLELQVEGQVMLPPLCARVAARRSITFKKLLRSRTREQAVRRRHS